MYLNHYIMFGVIAATFIINSENVWSMDIEDKDPSSQRATCPRKSPPSPSPFDLENATVDARFEHFFRLLNTKIEKRKNNPRILVPLYRQALKLAVKYSAEGSQAARDQKPLLENMLAFKLRALTQKASLTNQIEALRESCSLLRSSFMAGYLPAKANYGMALFEKSMLIDKRLEEDLNLTPLQKRQLQEEIIRDLKKSRKLLPIEIQKNTHLTLYTLLGLTLFKYAFVHREELEDTLVRNCSLRAREVLTQASNFHIFNEEEAYSLTVSLETVNDFLKVKYEI